MVGKGVGAGNTAAGTEEWWRALRLEEKFEEHKNNGRWAKDKRQTAVEDREDVVDEK